MLKEVKIKTIGKAEQRRLAIAEAMPEVQALAKKHSLSVIHSCVARIREYEKKAAQVEHLRKEADELERRLTSPGVKTKTA